MRKTSATSQLNLSSSGGLARSQQIFCFRFKIAMQCPFTFEEKQALLEAPSIEDRAELIVSLLTMAVAGHLNTSVTRH